MSDQVETPYTQDETQVEISPLSNKLVEWLQEAGYRAKLAENNNRIYSGASGLNFVITNYDRSVQFYMGMSIGDSGIREIDCNRYNREWRFVKTYLDADGDLCVEMDCFIDDNDIYKNVFLSSLALWDASLGRVKSWVASFGSDRSKD